MLVYAVAIAAVALVLYVSFRALAMEPAGGSDSAVAIEVTLASAASGVRQVMDSLAGDDPAGAARAGRRRVAAHEQQLSRLEPPEWDSEQAAGRDVLLAGLDALAWACRMIESPGYATNPGLRAAVERLVDHARSCAAAVTTTEPGLESARPFARSRPPASPTAASPGRPAPD